VSARFARRSFAPQKAPAPHSLLSGTMASLLFTSFALFSGCYANALLQPSRLAADPTITPGPRIPAALLQRQNNDRFMGWVSYDGEWISHDCQEGATLAQNGQYWICCGTDQPSCDMPMGCMSGSLIYDLTDSLSTLASGSITRATVAWYALPYGHRKASKDRDLG
jgi:hypothetical protein